jgi:hypothetical protein
MLPMDIPKRRDADQADYIRTSMRIVPDHHLLILRTYSRSL